MERVFSKIWVLSLALIALPSLAGVVLVQPPPSAAPTPEEYPESRFGAAPADPSQGVTRRPAGLMFEGQTATAPVRPDYDFDKKEPIGAAPQKTVEVADADPGSMLKGPQDLVPSSTKGIQEVALIAGDLGFFPNTVFVTRDVPVRLFVTGASKSTLCIMIDSFNVKKQVRTQRIEEITFTPNMPGKYRFYCPVNGMEGTMVVREIASVK
jgi:heme/copper-type cytochrome/quinol oxidase subunit 2